MEERLEQAELDRLWLPGDPIASEERLADAVARSDRSEVVRAELETQRARALGLQGRIEEGEALLDSLEPASGVLEVRVLLERGRLRLAADRLEEAVPLLEAALRAARRDGDTGLALETALTLAEADAPRSEQWVEEGLADLAGTGDPRLLRFGAVLFDLRGWARFADGDAAAALVSFEDAVRAAELYGTPDQRFAAQWAVGRALRALGRTTEALAVQRRLQEERPDARAVAAELAELERSTEQRPTGTDPSTGSGGRPFPTAPPTDGAVPGETHTIES
ncbi:tetratricopeptide repeat protein [Leifsonia sp. 22587]|uniref:tetratricopeptide repeat protein n=1 Tax=Leifsonia sp. 22587 TaxID=3453946 RepID=UPI003F82B518